MSDLGFTALRLRMMLPTWWPLTNPIMNGVTYLVVPHALRSGAFFGRKADNGAQAFSEKGPNVVVCWMREAYKQKHTIE